MRKNIFLHSILAALTAVSITLASSDIPSSKHPAGKATAAQSDDSFTLGNKLLSASFQWKDGGVQFGGLKGPDGTELLQSGFTDSFRHLHPDEKDRYSWWSYMFHARERNTGWRIDYFIVSDRVKDMIRAAEIHDQVMGSDHCPVLIDIDI